jgi:predicted DNA-binding transcriptional regulator AlpA
MQRRLNLIRMAQLAEKVGVSIPRAYTMVSEGDLPKPVATGKHTRAWVEEEVDQAIEKWIAARDQGTDAELRATSPHIARGRQDLAKAKAEAEAKLDPTVGERQARARRAEDRRRQSEHPEPPLAA